MGAGASAPRQPLQSLSADSIKELVESLGPKFADIGEQLQENGYDGAILADASDEDLDELFAELEVPKLKQYWCVGACQVPFIAVRAWGSPSGRLVARWVLVPSP